MTEMSVTGTLSDLVTEAENSVTEGQRDEAPADTDSDSGDSLFITQKPVPEAVRSGRRRCSSFRSDPPSLADADGSDDSASPEECKTGRKKKTKRIKLPKHSFSFLRQRKFGRLRIEELKIKQNTSLHSAVMAGFFKCVRDLWQSYQGKKDLSSLPTVDMPEESISPISEEEEEEKPEDEDIRVVEKKRLVVSLKAKSSQPWCTSSQGGDQEKKQSVERSTKVRHETLQGRQRKTLAPKSREILSTDGSSDEEGESSSRALVERKTSEKLVACNTSATETPKTKKRKENEGDGSASVCELSPNSPEASADVTEPQEDGELPQTEQAESEPEGRNLLQTDASDATMCSESRVKKKKVKERRGHEAVEEEEEKSRSRSDVRVTEVEESPGVSQSVAELEIHDVNATEGLSHDDNMISVEERDIHDAKKKMKKKKKRSKLAAEDVTEEEDGHFESEVRVEEEEDGVFSGSCDVDNGGKEKKKKKKKRNEDDELLKSDLQSELLNDVAEKPKRKKKKKKDVASEPAEQLQEVEDCLEEASREMGESGYVEGKKQKKKKKAPSSDHVGEYDCIDVNFSNEKNTKEDENVDNVQNTTDQDAELLRLLSKDTVAQSDDSVSVRKKKKKKKRSGSFLVADAEENAARTCEETLSMAADEPAGESAESTGSLEKADDGLRKKKKKKKRKKVSAEEEKAGEDFEEADGTCQTAVAETGDGRKKKRRREDSESVTSVETAERESQAAKQKKKRKKDTREIPQAAGENNDSDESQRNICVPLSHKKKSSTVAAKGINETCNDSRAANDQATLEAVAKRASSSSETAENQAGNDARGKKKKKKVQAAQSDLLEGKSCIEADEIEAPKPKKKKKKDRTQPAAESSLSSAFSDSVLSQSETTSSHRSRKNKHKKAKHGHFNPIESFITEC